MKLRDDNHLHIDKQDPIADWLVRSMRTAQTGSIKLDIEGQPTVKIDIVNYEKNNCSQYFSEHLMTKQAYLIN